MSTTTDELFQRKPYLLNASAVQIAGELGCTQAEAERRQMAARELHFAERSRVASERAVANVKAKLIAARSQADRARSRAESEQNPVRAARARLDAAQYDNEAVVLDARLRAMSSGRRLARHLADVETR